MKLYFLSALLLCNISVFAQQSISDYQYIYVPKKFVDFKTENQYNLSTALSKALTAKKYQIIRNDEENWPAELKLNPCKVLTADVKNNSNMLRNRIILDFTDCHKKAVASLKATSLEKDFEVGYNDALKQALVSIPVSDPKESIAIHTDSVSAPVSVSKTEKAESAKTEPVKTTTQLEPEKVQVESNTQAASSAEMYTFNQENFQKVQIGNGGFILVSPKSSVPYATFYPSAKAGVYRVNLQNGSMTLGYEEKGNLVVEMPNANGTFSNQVLIKK